MSIRTILVHADPGEGCERRVRLAAKLADLFGATITGLGAEAFNPILVSGDAGVDGAMIEVIRERVAVDLPAAQKHFAALTAGRAGTRWVAAADYPDKVLALYARGADLVVASRPARGESATFCAAPADLIMEAGGPVLLAADGGAAFRGDRVVVGWKDVRESRRAVSDSLPFLVRAKAVSLVAVSGEANAQADHAGLRDVARRLAAHGVEAEIEVAPKGRATVAEALEAAANRRGADLIVVGAYAHSRLREWALGGVTEDLIAASSKFVLFSH